MNKTITPSDFRAHFVELFRSALQSLAPHLNEMPITIERPQNSQHGDFACNLALQLAKPMRRNPREVASELIKALPTSLFVEKMEVAGAGFINIFLKPTAKQQVIINILQQGFRYGRSQAGQSKPIQIEFVSANPTGPLHVGHGRGAAFGASLANVLEAVGFNVSREYYVNDAGRQMDILALSTWLRYLELTGINVPFPPNAYQGTYVRSMAQQIHSAHGDRYIHQPWTILQNVPPQATAQEFEQDEKRAKEKNEIHLDALIESAKKLLGQDYAYVHDHVLTEQLGDCRNDLMGFGVNFDSWFSERSLYESGLIDRTVAKLERSGDIYEQDGAKWFRSTNYGDEKDRVVQRENGQYTYFASDIAYHLNKFERGYELMINIWGADHHGYIPRVKGALQALGLNDEQLRIALVQFAVLYREGKKVSMSTRAGDFVTLRELREEVGNDAARFFYVLRKSDQHLDFDLDLAKSQSNDNPVYYVQYAHARICSVLEQWGGTPAVLESANISLLQDDHELGLLQRLIEYPEIIEAAAREFSPHLIAFYLKDLAADFHRYYNAMHFLVPDESLKVARLALITSIKQVLFNGLNLLGVSAPEKM